MPNKREHSSGISALKRSLYQLDTNGGVTRGWLFHDVVVFIDGSGSVSDTKPSPKDTTDRQQETDMRLSSAARVLRFGGAKIAYDLTDESLTHVVVEGDEDGRRRIKSIREQLKWYVPVRDSLEQNTRSELFLPTTKRGNADERDED